jgi:murein DD-endopeptidase MepM/ murein hydrolase activator NlpD
MDINKNREPEDRPLEVASKPMPGHALINDVALINRYIKLLLAKVTDEDSFDEVDPEEALGAIKETPEVKSPYAEQTQPELGAFKPEKGLIRSGVEAVRNVTFAIPILGSTLKGWFGEKEIQPIEGLRLLQYGASLEDATFVAALRDLEETVIDDVEWKGGVPTWDLDEFDDLYDDVRSDFGMLDDPQDYLIFKTWFIRRFLAVLMMHLMALYQLDEDMDLEDLDEDLETDKKRQFISAVDKSDFMDVTESPMRGHPILKNAYVIQVYIRKLLDTLNSTGDLEAFDEHFLPEAAVTDPKIRFQMEKNLEKAKQSASESRAVVSTEKVDRKDYSKIADRVKQRINEYRKTSTKMDLIPPIEDGIISSEFGERTDPFGSKKSNHKGIDFAAPTGTPVMAAGDGVIARKGSSKSYGNVIYIRHPNGTYTRYAHLHSFAEDLEIGNKVKQGEVIGYVGSTGYSTGPHLHFEYRRGMYNDSEAMDPMPNFVASYRKTLEKQVAEATSEPETDGLEGVDTLGNQDTPKTRVGLVAKEASLEARQASEEYGGKTSIPVQDVASLATGLNQEAKSITPPKIEVVQDNTPIKDLINKQDVIANGAVSQREAMLQSQKEIIAQLAAVAAALKEKETVVVASNTGEPMPVKEKVKSDSRKESPWPRTRNTRGVLDLTS